MINKYTQPVLTPYVPQYTPPDLGMHMQMLKDQRDRLDQMSAMDARAKMLYQSIGIDPNTETGASVNRYIQNSLDGAANSGGSLNERYRNVTAEAMRAQGVFSSYENAKNSLATSQEDYLKDMKDKDDKFVRAFTTPGEIVFDEEAGAFSYKGPNSIAAIPDKMDIGQRAIDLQKQLNPGLVSEMTIVQGSDGKSMIRYNEGIDEYVASRKVYESLLADPAVRDQVNASALYYQLQHDGERNSVDGLMQQVGSEESKKHIEEVRNKLVQQGLEEDEIYGRIKADMEIAELAGATGALGAYALPVIETANIGAPENNFETVLAGQSPNPVINNRLLRVGELVRANDPFKLVPGPNGFGLLSEGWGVIANRIGIDRLDKFNELKPEDLYAEGTNLSDQERRYLKNLVESTPKKENQNMASYYQDLKKKHQQEVDLLSSVSYTFENAADEATIEKLNRDNILTRSGKAGKFYNNNVVVTEILENTYGDQVRISDIASIKDLKDPKSDKSLTVYGRVRGGFIDGEGYLMRDQDGKQYFVHENPAKSDRYSSSTRMNRLNLSFSGTEEEFQVGDQKLTFERVRETDDNGNVVGIYTQVVDPRNGKVYINKPGHPTVEKFKVLETAAITGN